MFEELLGDFLSSVKEALIEDFKRKDFKRDKTAITKETFDDVEIIGEILNREKSKQYLIIIDTTKNLELDFFINALTQLGYNSFKVEIRNENRLVIKVAYFDFY